MNNKWKVSPLNEVCSEIIDCVNKTAPIVEYETPYKMIRTTNVKEGRVNLDEVRFVEKDTYKKWTRRAKPRRNDIILTREAPLGEVGILRSDDNIFLGQRLIQYRANPKVIDQMYLFYSFQGSYMQGQIRSYGSGSTVEHLRIGDCETIKVKYPPLPIQKKIASILSAYDELIENNNQRIKLLEEMVEEIYKEWFVRLRFPGYEHTPIKDGVPEGWCIKRLVDITSLIKRGISPGYDDEGDSLAINQRCIRNHKIDLSIARRQSKKIANEKILKNGDVLINSTGEGTLGRVAQYFGNEKNLTADSHVTIVRAKGVDEFFLGDAIISLEKLFEYSAVGSTGQTELNREIVCNTKITVPPEVLQRRYSDIVKPIREQIKLLIEKNQVLKETRDLLLPRLISGKLSVEHLLEGEIHSAMVAEPNNT